MGRWLALFGIALVVLGLAWPWLSKLGLGRLPGDLRIEREGFGFYFPLTTSLIVSIVARASALAVPALTRGRGRENRLSCASRFPCARSSAD
jgi:ABC-type phosphate transport system permease subunit